MVISDLRFFFYFIKRKVVVYTIYKAKFDGNYLKMRRQNSFKDKKDNAQKSMSNNNRLEEILGEISDSVYESPSTDENATNYNLSNLNKTSEILP